MEISKKLSVFFLLSWSFVTVAQMPTPTLPENGIYLTEKDFIQRKLTLPFDKEERPRTVLRRPLGHYYELWEKTKDTVYKFANDEIWGYRKKGIDQRIVNSIDYRVDYTGKIILYSTPPDVSTEGSTWTSYFSRTLHSPVHELNRKLLKAVYHDNPRFIKHISQLKRFQSLYKKNKKTGNYRFIDWL